MSVLGAVRRKLVSIVTPMNDVRLRWSVWPWTRYFDDDRHPGVPGAAITDSRRQLTYRATIDAAGELDHLEIEMSGRIDEARLARLRSIPRERIQAAVAAFLRDRDPEAIEFIPEGGLLVEDGTPGRTPTSDKVAALMAKGWGRQELATRYDCSVRTADGWIAKARAEHGDAVPRPATGRGYRAKKTSGSTQQPGDRKEEQ